MTDKTNVQAANILEFIVREVLVENNVHDNCFCINREDVSVYNGTNHFFLNTYYEDVFHIKIEMFGRIRNKQYSYSDPDSIKRIRDNLSEFLKPKYFSTE